MIHPLLRHRFTMAVTLGLCCLFPGCAPRHATDTPPTEATHYVLGCSPFFERDQKDELFRRIVAFLLEEVPLGSSLHVYDAYHLRSIAQFDLPRQNAFASPRTRINQFGKQIQALKTFLAQDHEPPALKEIRFVEAVRLPQFLAFVGNHFPSGQTNLSVLILGSPLYLDDKEPSFSMVDGYFPSDGHLLATRERSVFGTEDATPGLPHAVVHFMHVEDPWLNDVHRTCVRRFWAHYMARIGARLGAFCGDWTTAFQALAQPPPDPQTTGSIGELDPAQTKIQMLRVSRLIGITDWITKDLATEPAPLPPNVERGPLKIGIRWSANVDLDLYARPHSSAKTLFFDHPRSAEGYYFKDHRSSPDREFEFIEFPSPVIARDVEAFINFYEGELSGHVEGEIRLEFGDRIYSRPFTLQAKHGNQGRRGAGQEHFWERIDVPAILGMSPQHAARP